MCQVTVLFAKKYHFVSLFKLAIFRDQGYIWEVVAVRQSSQRNSSIITIPPPQPAFMLELLSSFFPHSSSSTKFSKNSADHLLVHLLVHQPISPPPNVGTSVVVLLSLLVIHLQLGLLWSSPSECKSIGWEVILHEESMKDWTLAGVKLSFISVLSIFPHSPHFPFPAR